MHTKKLAQYLKSAKKDGEEVIYTVNTGETLLIADGKALFSVSPSTVLPEYWSNDGVQRRFNMETQEWEEQEKPFPKLVESFKDWSNLPTLSPLKQTNWLYEHTHYNAPSDIARRLVYTDDEEGKVQSIFVDTLYLSLFNFEKGGYELERVKLWNTSKVSTVRVVHCSSYWKQGKGTITTREPVAFIMPFHMEGIDYNNERPERGRGQ